MELGQAIVRELELDARGNVLERWLAHHLAELMLVAESATGHEKEQAEREAVDLILKLWMHRRALPAPVDPLGGYREAIAVLARMMPDADPWRQYRHNHTYEGLLQEMFETFSRAVVGGLLLTHLGHVRAFSTAESAALEEEELFLKTALDKSLEILPVRPKVEYVIVDPDSLEADKQDDLSAGESGDLTPEKQVAKLEANIHLAIATHIQHMQEKLSDLLARWRAATPDEDRIDENTIGDLEESD